MYRIDKKTRSYYIAHELYKYPVIHHDEKEYKKEYIYM